MMCGGRAVCGCIALRETQENRQMNGGLYYEKVNNRVKQLLGACLAVGMLASLAACQRQDGPEQPTGVENYQSNGRICSGYGDYGGNRGS